MCAPCMAEQDKARKSSPEARLKIRISKIASKYKVNHPGFRGGLSS